MSYEFSPLQLIFCQKPNSATFMNCSTTIHKDELKVRLEIYIECESLFLTLREKIGSWKKRLANNELSYSDPRTVQCEPEVQMIIHV